MSVQAYITAGATVIPVLLPTQPMRDTARQIGIPESDLFRIDVPCGMTRHTSASVLIPSTSISTLYGSTTVSLTLEDSSGLSVSFATLYARPPQPFFWGDQGGVALVELVDERWYWKFSSAAQLNQALTPLWSSDGRWQVNAADMTTYSQLLSLISTAASGDNLTAPSNFTTQSPEYLRRLSDLVGSPNVSLALLLDAIAVANTQIIVTTGNGTGFISRSTLKAQYNAKMVLYKTAYRGGMQPVNGAASSTDTLVNLWNASGYQARAPQSCSVIMPQRSVEGLTVYDNCNTANTPSTQQNFTQKQIYAAGSSPTWVRAPNDIGAGYITDSSVVTVDASGAVLTASPGWNPTAMSTVIRNDYASRYSNIPFGRTVWAGWIPWLSDLSSNIGQIGNVSYRLAEVDGDMAPFTISEAREDDWIFGLQGCAETDPGQLVTAKGKAQAYRNCVGATVIDVPPPNTRVFPAKITASELISNWKWMYSWVEVEPGAPGTAAPAVTIGAYARTGTTNARNMAENGNVFVSSGNSGNIVAPGIYQSDYTGGQVITAQPIRNDTIVEMVEQFNTSQSSGLPSVPRYWFSMPNAVKVTCSGG